MKTLSHVISVRLSNAYPAHETAILDAYGDTGTLSPTGCTGRSKGPYKTPRRA